MTGARWLNVATIALAFVVVAGLGFALRPQQTPTVDLGPSSVRVDRPQQAPLGPTVLFLGDTYALGYGQKESYYGCVAATRMGWVCDVSAVPSTGYLAGGPKNRFIVNNIIGQSTTFAERVPDLALVYRPDVVVLDGGRFDLAMPRNEVFDAMTWTLFVIRQAWPQAKIVFIRPRMLTRPADDLGFDEQLINRLRTEPVGVGMVVIDPIAKLASRDTSTLLSFRAMHGTDADVFPNKDGEIALAAVLADALVGAGISPPS